MATRKTEWLASIKPILDKEEVKNDAKALAKELSDILEFNVTDADSFEQLTKEFNKQLSNMGKQQIVFSEKTLQGIVSQFANAVAAGFAKGADIGIQESSKTLQAEKDQFIAQQKQLQAQKRKFEKIQDWTYDIEEMEDNEFHFFNSDEIKAMKKEAKNIGISFDDYVLKIKKEVEELQWSISKMEKGQMPWNNDVIAKFYERSQDMFRMSKTLSKYPDIVQDKEILVDYDFADLKDLFSEDLYNYADQFDAVVTSVDRSLDEVKIKIAEIDTKLKTAGDHSGDIVDNQGLKDGLKTLQEIEEAYGRILTQDKNRPQRPNQKKVKNIQKALEWQPTGTEKDDGIKVVSQQYQRAKDTGDWVQKYEALLKYVRLYESYLNSENKTYRNKVTKPGNDFTKLYNQIKPMYENAENALRQLLNMAKSEVSPGVTSGSEAKSGNIQAILKDMDKFLSSNTDKKIEDYFKLIAARAYEMSDDVKSAIEATIGSIGTLSSIDIGANNLGGLIGEKSALILRKPHFNRDKQKWSTDEPNDNAITLQNRLSDANISDVNLGKIQEVIKAEEYLVELQNRVSGSPISTIGESIEGINPDVLNATETSIKSLVQAMRELYNIGVEVDVENLGNILYDGKSDRFGIVDMDVKHDFESFEEMLSAFAQTVRNQVEDISNILNNPNMAQAWSRFADRIDNEVEKAKAILSTADGFNAHKENIKAIQDETKAQDELKNIQNQDVDDDSETIIKENGLLEYRLELLRDIADQYASNITQKQRDRYEELNQKDMDTGLSDKEEERYYELGEQIDAADNALEEFGQTYDKIILKLENGKKVEILPDDKGLRSLYKFADEYGETYDGIEIEDVIFERVKQETSAHQENTQAIKDETKAQEELNTSKVQGVGSGDASSADVAAANAEAEKQRIEKERIEAEKLALQQEITNKNEELERVRDELANEIYRNSEDRGELYTQISDAEFERDKAQEYQRRAEAESREKDGIIQGLREQLTQVQSGEGGAKASIDVEELKNVLNAITYNVKVVQDADSTDNKVAIDETSLEATLNKVFSNILNPRPLEQQNDLESKQEHWALESTLQTVKGVLDNIQTNTAKIGTVNASNVDTIAGTALDGRLVEIKNVLDSIDNKIAKGGVIATRGAVKQASANAQETPAKTQAVRSNMMKSIINDYETLGKLSAQFANDGNLETKARLENLKEEIKRKRESLKVTIEESTKLREKYSIAFDAQKRLLDAAKAQEKIDKQDKDDEKAWKKRVKDAQRASGINAATSAANAGDQSVLRAIGTDGISADIERQARELSNRIKELRALRDEIDKKGNKASEEDRDNLSKQISQVKTLKTELDGYLKIHEKYSGENATQFDNVNTSNFGAVGTDQYWRNITSAIQEWSKSKVIIKGMNADTGELTGTTKIAANTFAEWSATVDPITHKLSMVRTGIKKTETLVESITRKTKEIFTYFSGSSIIFKFFNELKQGVQYVKEIDLAMTELKKVTDETEETYDKFLKAAAKTGARLGTTISAVTEATATFAKLGYSIEQAAEMAEAALVYKNVGDNIASAEDAADSIISTLKGFKLEASDSMLIVDKFNEVGNRFAITSQGIGEALRLSASALNEGKNSLDESIALITAANEVVNDPSSVGTALKTLTLRLRGSKTELEEMGEDVTDMATTTSQLQAKLLSLTGGKVDIMLDENTFKNSTEIKIMSPYKETYMLCA